MKKQTAVAEIVYMSNFLNSYDFKKWFDKNAQDLIKQEKEQIVNGWVEGNRRGWAMETDWPEHGEEYYNETYRTK